MRFHLQELPIKEDSVKEHSNESHVSEVKAEKVTGICRRGIETEVRGE
jgi:hypothetical protein